MALRQVKLIKMGLPHNGWVDTTCANISIFRTDVHFRCTIKHGKRMSIQMLGRLVSFYPHLMLMPSVTIMLTVIKTNVFVVNVVTHTIVPNPAYLANAS